MGEQHGTMVIGNVVKATELKISVNGVIVDEEKEKLEQEYKREIQAKLKKDTIRKEFDGFTYGELLLEKCRLDKMNRLNMTGEERLEHEMRKNILNQIIGDLKAQLHNICDVEVVIFIVWIIFTVFYGWFGVILCGLGEATASTIVILYTIITSAYIVANVVYYFGSRLIVASSLKYKYISSHSR